MDVHRGRDPARRMRRFVLNVLPSAKSHGSLIYHYNIYLGIDDVRGWEWSLILPGIWLLMTLVDVALAYGEFRTDKHLSAALVSLALAWSFPWMGALFYLSILNL